MKKTKTLTLNLLPDMKTLRQETIEPEFVDSIPNREEMLPGKLYISREYQASSHLCLCGCGQEAFIPLDHNGWTLTEHSDGKISLSPSMHHRFECRSHYIITRNKANFV